MSNDKPRKHLCKPFGHLRCYKAYLIERGYRGARNRRKLSNCRSRFLEHTKSPSRPWMASAVEVDSWWPLTSTRKWLWPLSQRWCSSVKEYSIIREVDKRQMFSTCVRLINKYTRKLPTGLNGAFDCRHLQSGQIRMQARLPFCVFPASWKNQWSYKTIGGWMLCSQKRP